MTGSTLTRRAVAGCLLGAGLFRAAAAAQPAPVLKRGINIHGVLNWPDVVKRDGGVDYVWPPFRDRRFNLTQDMLSLARLGFDFIRLTVDPSILLASPDDRVAMLHDHIVETVRRLVAAGLSVVVDLHPVAVNPAYAPDILVAPANAQLFDRYCSMAAALGGVLQSLATDRVWFEVMNEPRLVRSSEFPRWQQMLVHLHGAVRAKAPSLGLVLTGAQWSSIGALLQLDPAPFRGSNVLYTFHYYDPHTFTHQKVRGEDAQYIQGLRWPPEPGQAETILAESATVIENDARVAPDAKAMIVARTRKLVADYMRTPSSPAEIRARFDDVRAWAARNGIPASRILLGEFGAGWAIADTSVGADRLAWLSVVRTAAEERGFPWAYWTYEAPLRPDVLAALGRG